MTTSLKDDTRIKRVVEKAPYFRQAIAVNLI
jgi:hypothetical protein